MDNVSIAGACLVNPKLAEKLGNNKGTIGNQIDYEVKQTVNTAKTLARDTFTTAAGVAATAGATAVVAKSPTAQKTITKVITAAADKLKNNKGFMNVLNKAKPFVQKGFETLKALPGPAKAILGAGAVLTGILSFASHTKGVYEAGKIDQEYTDKAKLQKTLSEKI